MKVSTDLPPSEHNRGAAPQRFTLPEGLVGLPQHKSFEVVQVPDQEPFMWLQLQGPDPLNFVVLEPQGIIPDYELELFDEDAEFLGILDSADALVLNIVTLRNNNPAEATVNLAGPIIINRHTGVAKQCILANYFRYSAHHRLVGSANAGA
jgi:flagellar assembly factor FliW